MTVYDKKFYEYTKRVGTVRTQIILPLFESYYKPKSVVDVGCGIGLWANYFHKKGCDVLGIDGSYVDKNLLEIPQNKFLPIDIEKERISLNKRYDLCISIEVAEHLTPERAETFIADLCDLSDNILFSAAIKGQSGVGHINCQYQNYWEKLFKERGYTAYDFLGNILWHDEKLLENNSALILQNIIFYTKNTNFINNFNTCAVVTDKIHPYIYDRLLNKYNDMGRKLNESTKTLQTLKNNWWYKFSLLPKSEKIVVLVKMLFFHISPFTKKNYPRHKSPMNNSTELSIIVPVFNVEKFLEKALTSVIGQSFKNIEIILIDDCSTDKSPDICKSFQKKDNRVVYLALPENKGYGHACNTGLKKATGEYVTIFEPDDFIATRTYSDVVEKAKKHNIDLIRFGFFLYENGKKYSSSYLKKIRDLKIPTNKVINILDYPEYISYQPTVWGFVYKKSFLVNNSIWFLETPGASYQDNSFYFKALSLSKTIMILKKQYYFYRQHPQQSINDRGKLDAPIIELMEIKNFCDTTIKKNRSREDYNKIYFQLVNRSIDYFSIHINRLELELKYIFYSKIKRYIIETVVNHEQYQFYFSNLNKHRKDCLLSLLNSESLNEYLVYQNSYITTDGGVEPFKEKPIIGQSIGVERLTPPFEQMFSGYFDIKVMDSKNENHLALRVPFIDRLPRKNDTAEICIIDREKNIRVVDATSAWCFQQANFLQFVPNSDDEVVYNIYDETAQKYCAVVYNISTSSKKYLPLPVANISANGEKAVSINFSRLFDYRPGYGYCNLKDPHYSEKKPTNDGIFLMDMQTGDNSLIISYDRLWNIFAKGTEVEKDKILINHINFNLDNSQVIFLLRFFSKKAPWPTITVTMNISGGNVRKVFGFGSHYHWKNNTELVLSGENIFHRKDRTVITAYHLNTKTLETYPIDKHFFTGDGHCSYSPDRQYILYDSYPTVHIPYRKLMLYDIDSHQGIVLMYLRSDKSLHGFNDDCRCDLHPRWSTNGKYISFDSTHEGFRGIYRIKTKEAVAVLNSNYNQLNIKEVESILYAEKAKTGKRMVIDLIKKITQKIGVFYFLNNIAVELNINTK